MDSDDVFAAGCLCALFAPVLFPLYLLVVFATWLYKLIERNRP